MQRIFYSIPVEQFRCRLDKC